MKLTKDVWNKVIMILFGTMFLFTLSAGNTNVIYGAESLFQDTEVVLQAGEQRTLELNTSVSGNISWTSSNTFAVTVDTKGKVTAVNPGHAIITVSNGMLTAKCKVTVTDASRTIKLNRTSVTLREKETYVLVATVQIPPETTADSTIRQSQAVVSSGVQSPMKQAAPISQEVPRFISENEAVAKVDINGKITAVNKGRTVITVYTSKGVATCPVRVKKALTETKKTVNKNKKAIRIIVGKKIQYTDIVRAVGVKTKVTIDNIDTSKVKKVKWSVADKTIISAGTDKKSLKFEFTGRKAGKTKIRVKVTYKSGKVKNYKRNVWITDPKRVSGSLVVVTDASGRVTADAEVTGFRKNSTITWKNSDTTGTFTKVSTKNNHASMIGKATGSGKLKAYVDGKKLTFKYKVVSPVIDKNSILMSMGEKQKIMVTGADGIAIKFASRNPLVASVASDGTVTGVGAGVTYMDIKVGSVSYTCRVEVAAEGMMQIIEQGNYMVNNWTYSQPLRMQDQYYDCSSLVWKAYNMAGLAGLLGNTQYAPTAASTFDYLNSMGQIVTYGFVDKDYMQPGDLIFYGDYENAVKYSTPGRTLDIYHVSMYIGDGKVVEKGGQTLDYNGTEYIVGVGRVK